MSEQTLEVLRSRLQEAFTPTLLEIIDQSHLHRGHAGAQGGAGHFKLIIQAPAFAGKSMLACHRLIYAQLDDLIPTKVHALTIDIKR